MKRSKSRNNKNVFHPVVNQDIRNNLHYKVHTNAAIVESIRILGAKVGHPLIKYGLLTYGAVQIADKIAGKNTTTDLKAAFTISGLELFSIPESMLIILILFLVILILSGWVFFERFRSASLLKSKSEYIKELEAKQHPNRQSSQLGANGDTNREDL